ncbi:hypothetical protein GWA97_05315 [Flavobacterium sp. LaA7.5]|nr:hypothetical protein [Flavobacterium salilacus subsp. altitudinum]
MLQNNQECKLPLTETIYVITRVYEKRLSMKRQDGSVHCETAYSVDLEEKDNPKVKISHVSAKDITLL